MSDVVPDKMLYEPVPFWGKVPHGMTFRGSATSVAVDRQDRVYVFNRGSHPLMVFDPDGNMLEAWSDPGQFGRPHSIRINDDDTMFLVDDGDHVIEKRSLDGEIVLNLGEKGNPYAWEGGGTGRLFNRPTDIGVHPSTGDLFVCDGYGNSRIHRFTAAGGHVTSWGEAGTDPGQFSLPHGIAVTPDDRVLVVDRENFRIQVFSLEGEFLEHWWIHRPFCISIGRQEEPLVYIGQGRSVIPNRKGVPRLGSRISVHRLDGTEVARFGDDLPGFEPQQFMGLHSIAVDSRGDVYVAEVANAWIADLTEPPPLGEWPSLRKWRLVTA
jgi:hypothetical protein